MNAKKHRRSIAIVACAVPLGGTALAIAPAAASAATKCANKVIAVKPAGGPTVHLPIKSISVQGLTCAQAYPVLVLIETGKSPKAWKTVPAHFTLPPGQVPSEAKASGGRIIKYGAPGG
jgi:hypothetical protein